MAEWLRSSLQLFRWIQTDAQYDCEFVFIYLLFFLHKKGNYGESVAIRRNKTPSIRAGTYLGILLDSRGISLDRPPALLLLLLLRPNPFDEEPRRRPRRSERAASFSRRPSAVASFKSRPTRTGAGTRRSARQSKGRLLLFCFCSLHCVCVGFFFQFQFHERCTDLLDS